MGSAISKVTGALGLTADPNAGSGAAASATAQYKRMMAELDKLQIPDIEKQKIMLQIPELAGVLQAEQLGTSAMEGLTADQQAVESQRSALNTLQELADKGFTEEDRAASRQLSRAVGADEQARQASILAEMAARGQASGGQELAARLASSQGAAARQAQSADQLAIDQANARKAALAQLGSQAGALRQQDYQEKSSAAQARDTINQFNALQRAQAAQTNLGNRQAQMNQAAALQNQQQMYNKGLVQQQFQNQLSKASGQQAAAGNLAQNYQQQANAQAQAAQAQAQGTRDLLIGGAALAMSPALAMSDIRVKENIQPASTKEGDLKDMLDKITPAQYDYKNEVGGEPNQVGVMAQDLEKSKIGKQFVQEADDGTKMVDYGKMSPMFLAAIKDLTDRLDKMEGSKVGEQPSPDIIDSTVGTRKEQSLYANGGLANMMQAGDQTVGATDVAAPSSPLDKDKIMQAIKMMAGGAKTSQPQIQAPQMQFQNPAEAALRMLGKGSQFANGGGEEAEVEMMERRPDGKRYDESLDDGEMELNDDAQDELLSVLRGLKSPEEMEEGRIIEGDSYSGDELPDRINSGEAVHTVKMQDRNKEMLHEAAEDKAELKGFKMLLRMLGKEK